MHERSPNGQLDDATEQARSDDCLADDCLSGADPAAWERLFARYSWLIQTVIRRYHLRPEDEADVYQEVCVTCWRELPMLRDHTRIGRWLATVASRHAWDARRRLHPDAVALMPLEDDDATSEVGNLTDGTAGPEEEVTRGELAARVREAVTQLPPRQRALVSALFFEDGSYAEIATRLGYSVDSIGSIRGRSFRALQSLLRDIEE